MRKYKIRVKTHFSPNFNLISVFSRNPHSYNDDYIYTKKVPYYLEYNKSMNKEMKKYNLMKYESSISFHDLKEIKLSNEVLVHG